MLTKHFVRILVVVLSIIIGSIWTQSSEKNNKLAPMQQLSPELTQTPETRCEVRIRDLPDKQPLFIDETGRSLMMPINGNLTWSRGAMSWIACVTGRDEENFVSGKTYNVYPIKCLHRHSFLMDNEEVNITSIKCTQKVTGSVVNSATKNPECPATWKRIGFVVPFDSNVIFYDLYYSCYNETDSSVLYTRYNMFGGEISNKCITTEYVPSFTDFGVTPEMPITEAYTYANQQSSLETLFKQNSTEIQAKKDVRWYFDRSYLQKGMLVPKEDQLFASWQWSTYFYLNAAPIWNEVNNGNWQHLTKHIRSFAINTGLSLEVYSGTNGTLALCTSDKFCPPFALANGRVPVPKWIWKIVVSPTKKEAVAFVLSNNPFSVEKPCCNGGDFGWSDNEFNKTSLPVVYVCTVRKLKCMMDVPKRDFSKF